MVAEWTALRFENEQDSRTCVTDRERSSRIPGWDGEAGTYLAYARRLRQYVQGTKIRERYPCGPRLEAPLTRRSGCGETAALPQDTQVTSSGEPLASWGTVAILAHVHG